MTPDIATHVRKSTHTVYSAFGADLAGIRTAYTNRFVTADTAVDEFRRACDEAGRRLVALEALGAS